MRSWRLAAGTIAAGLCATAAMIAAPASAAGSSPGGTAAPAVAAPAATSAATAPAVQPGAPPGGTSASPSGSGGSDGSGLPPVVDPNAPFVLMADIFVLVPQGPEVHVEQLVTGANRSTATVHNLTFALPPAALDVRPESGIPAGAFHTDSSGVHLQMDVPPGGQVRAAFVYTVSWAGGQVWLPVSYPTGEVTAMVPHGRWLAHGAGFSPSGRLNLSGALAVDTYTTVTPSAGALLPLRLRAVAWWNGIYARIGLGAAAALLIGAGLAVYVRRRRAGRVRRESELIDALAELDLAHEQGTLADDPYRDRRQSLLDELAGVHGG